MVNTKIKDFMGIEYESITAMCEAHGVTRSAYNHRIARGWTQEEALTKAVRKMDLHSPLSPAEKSSKYNKTYYAAHREQEKARRKEYRDAHRDEENRKRREYYDTHREQEKARRDTPEMKEYQRDYHKVYYAAHREELNAKARAKYKAAKEAVAVAG